MRRLESRLEVVEWGFAKAKLHFAKMYFFQKKVSRGDLVPNLSQIGHPRGAKMEPKSEPRRSKKGEEK